MPDQDPPAGGEPVNDPTNGGDAPVIGDGLPANDPNGEGTTPEEVAEVLRGAGMHVPDEPAAGDPDEEEGNLDEGDPDPETDPPAAGDPDPAEDEGDPEADPALEEDEGDPDKDPELTTIDQDKYSFTVTDANGVAFKVKAGDDLEDVLQDFEPTGYGQLIKIGQQLTALENQQVSDQAAEADQTAKAEHAQRVSEIQKGWNEEIKDLAAQKRIPEGKDGEARADAVYKFMAEENTARTKAGKPPLATFEDALDKLENKEARAAAVQADKDAKETAKKNGALVGGNSAPASTAAKIYKAGSARNANEAIRNMGLL